MRFLGNKTQEQKTTTWHDLGQKNAIKAAGVAAVALLAFGAPATSQTAGRDVFDSINGDHGVSISLSLKARFGPVELARGTMDVTLDHDSYTGSTTYRTSGLGSAIATGAGSARVRGVVANESLRPTNYVSEGSTGARRRTTITYGGGEPNANTSPAYDDMGSPPASAADRRNTVDPLTGLIELSLITGRDRGQPCGGTVRIYDGKRRYDISTRFLRTERTNTPAFRGMATVCAATYTEIAGFKPKPANERAPVQMTMWLADIANNGASVPIRMRGGRNGINVTITAERASVR